MKVSKRYLLVWLFLPQKGKILVSARQNDITGFFDILPDLHLN